MGLYERPDGLERDLAVRVYAPVGGYRDLLAYLVRRLLENGANTSFVHQIADKRISATRPCWPIRWSGRWTGPDRPSAIVRRRPALFGDGAAQFRGPRFLRRHGHHVADLIGAMAEVLAGVRGPPRRMIAARMARGVAASVADPARSSTAGSERM